ncbi:MAG: G8 domain-containing protein, partial [Rubrivivax sp.]
MIPASRRPGGRHTHTPRRTSHVCRTGRLMQAGDTIGGPCRRGLAAGAGAEPGKLRAGAPRRCRVRALAPRAGDAVVINATQYVLMDVNPPQLASIVVQGRLEFVDNGPRVLS